MTRWLLALFFLINFKWCFSQEKLYWQDRKIQWDDFKGETIPGSDVASKATVQMEIDGDKITINKVEYEKYIIRVYMIKYSSWANPKDTNVNSLLFHQTLFDIKELYVRRLQNYLNFNEVSILDFVDKVFKEFDEEGINFIIQTNFGHDETMLKQWADSIRKELVNNPRRDSLILPYKVSKVGFGGLIAQIEYKLYGNSIGKYIGNNLNFMSGFDFMSGQFNFDFKFGIGFSKVTKDYQNSVNWPSGLKLKTGIFYGLLNYSVVNRGSVRISPMLGVGGLMLVPRKSKEHKDEGVFFIEKIAGVSISIFDNPFVAIAKKKKIMRIGETRFKLFVSHIAYDEYINGFTYNVSVGWGFYEKRIRFINK